MQGQRKPKNLNLSNRFWYATVKTLTARWSAHDYLSPDGLPFIGHLYHDSETLYTATGFSKWGLAAGAGSSLIIKNIIKGKKEKSVFDARRWNLKGLKELIKMEIHSAKHFLGDRLNQKNAPPASALKKGEGGICKYNGKTVAAYRNKNGKLNLMNPTCKHLGCRVIWNKADKTWDCPCHGSRYNKEGQILEGPTVYPLDAEDEK